MFVWCDIDDLSIHISSFNLQVTCDGAEATVTNLLIYLHNYCPYTARFKCPVRLTGTVGTTNIYPLGEGFLHLPAPNPSGYLGVCCFYSPHLTSTLVSPRDILKTWPNSKTGFSGQDMKTYFGPNGDPNFGHCTFTYHNNRCQSKNISIGDIVMDDNCYIYPLILPDWWCLHWKMWQIYCTCYFRTLQGSITRTWGWTSTTETPVNVNCKQLRISKYFNSLASVTPAVNPHQTALEATPLQDLLLQSIPINNICVETERILWYQWLGHPCDEYLYSTHKFIDGVPKFKRRSNVMSKCSTCIKVKMTKTAPGPNSTKRAVCHGQGLSIDFSFSGVKSKHTGRPKDYVGINGETCWVLITNHHTGISYGKTCQSKASPIEWLRDWLHIHSPYLRDKYVLLDQGDKLYSNPDIVNVFTKHWYEVHPTGTDSSHQNGPVNRAHQVVGEHVCALLIGAILDIKF